MAIARDPGGVTYQAFEAERSYRLAEGGMQQSEQGGDRAAMLAAFDKQIAWCNGLGAPFTARLLAALAEDIARGGPAATLVGGWIGDPVADALALRLAGALHALVLGGADPKLAACYRSGTQGDAEPLRPALLAALDEHADFLRGFLASPPQTNEVGRSAVLLGGFLEVAASARLPLRLLEIGSSAGLNLIWDHYQYRLADRRWGNPASPVRLQPDWEGPLPPLEAPLAVVERAGCDVAPVDLEQHDDRLRLRSYVWADQLDRLARLEAGIAVARRIGVMVERADAGTWVRAKLEVLAPGRATILFHSVMWQYMSTATQGAVRDAIDRAGARATEASPLAWLRLEPPRPDARPELHLTRWPGERQHRLGIAHPHGEFVQWLGS